MEHHAHPVVPPGYQFYPSEELLISYYLTKKNENREWGFYGSDLIMELDLYHHNPFELPDAACFLYGYKGNKRHWFCYTITKESKHKSRKVKNGLWLQKGKVREICGDGKVILGTKTRFIFYLSSSLKNATKTEWVMYEYALADNALASFVLCRVVNKPRHKSIPLGYCGEKSVVGALRHVGVQCDGCAESDVGEVKGYDDGFVNKDNKIVENSNRGGSEHEDIVAPTSVVQEGQLVQEMVFGLPLSNAYVKEAMTSQELVDSILEEDFIELNDIA